MTVAPGLVLLTDEYAPFFGGVATYVRSLAAAAARQRPGVEVWVTRAPAAVPPEDEPFACRSIGGRAGLDPRSQALQVLAIGRRLRCLDGRPLVFASYGTLTAGMALFALGALRGRPFGVVLHGSEVPQLDARAPRLAQRFLARASFVATNSTATASLLSSSRIGRGLPPPRRIACAAPEHLRPDGLPPRGVAPDPVRLLTVARVHPRKGHLDTVHAIGRLPETARRRIEYAIAGTGDPGCLARIVEASREHGVRLRRLGAVPDGELARVYRQADLYVQSSRTLPRSVEGFGITYLEAGSFGLPAVGYRSGGVVEAVLDGTTGILVPEGAIDLLAQAIGRMVAHGALRLEMGRAARTHASTFSWDRSAGELWASCDAAIGAGEPRVGVGRAAWSGR